MKFHGLHFLVFIITILSFHVKANVPAKLQKKSLSVASQEPCRQKKEKTTVGKKIKTFLSFCKCGIGAVAGFGSGRFTSRYTTKDPTVKNHLLKAGIKTAFETGVFAVCEYSKAFTEILGLEKYLGPVLTEKKSENGVEAEKFCQSCCQISGESLGEKMGGYNNFFIGEEDPRESQKIREHVVMCCAGKLLPKAAALTIFWHKDRQQVEEFLQKHAHDPEHAKKLLQSMVAHQLSPGSAWASFVANLTYSSFLARAKKRFTNPMAQATLNVLDKFAKSGVKNLTPVSCTASGISINLLAVGRKNKEEVAEKVK